MVDRNECYFYSPEKHRKINFVEVFIKSNYDVYFKNTIIKDETQNIIYCSE